MKEALHKYYLEYNNVEPLCHEFEDFLQTILKGNDVVAGEKEFQAALSTAIYSAVPKGWRHLHELEIQTPEGTRWVDEVLVSDKAVHISL